MCARGSTQAGSVTMTCEGWDEKPLRDHVLNSAAVASEARQIAQDATDGLEETNARIDKADEHLFELEQRLARIEAGRT